MTLLYYVLLLQYISMSDLLTKSLEMDIIKSEES